VAATDYSVMVTFAREYEGVIKQAAAAEMRSVASYVRGLIVADLTTKGLADATSGKPTVPAESAG